MAKDVIPCPSHVDSVVAIPTLNSHPNERGRAALVVVLPQFMAGQRALRRGAHFAGVARRFEGIASDALPCSAFQQVSRALAPQWLGNQVALASVFLRPSRSVSSNSASWRWRLAKRKRDD